MKVCSKCGKRKQLDAFPFQGSKRRADCKECAVKAERKRLYGISHKQYLELTAAQHGVCAVCFQPESATFHGKLKQLSVDHDHKTGKIRGLLCSKCNTALGLVDESCERLLSLIAYMERSRHSA